MSFAVEQFALSQKSVKVLWHGHNDRGMALGNAWQAIKSGASIISGTVLGVGERAGNIPIEQLILLLNEKHESDFDLKATMNYSRRFAEIANHPIGPNQPLVGSEIHRSGSGIHVAVEYLEGQSGRKLSGNCSYNSLPLQKMGLKFEAVLGPYSGRKNVKFVLESLGLDVTEHVEQEVLKSVKALDRCISATEVLSMVRNLQVIDERF